MLECIAGMLGVVIIFTIPVWLGLSLMWLFNYIEGGK